MSGEPVAFPVNGSRPCLGDAVGEIAAEFPLGSQVELGHSSAVVVARRFDAEMENYLIVLRTRRKGKRQISFPVGEME